MKKYQPENRNQLEENKEGEMMQRQQQPLLYNIFQRLLQDYIGANIGNSAREQGRCCAGSTAGQPNHTCSSAMIESLFKIVQEQTTSLESLSAKVQVVMNKNRNLHKKIEMLEKQNSALRAGKAIKVEPLCLKPSQQLKFAGEQVTQVSLLQLLFGKKQYKYELRLTDKLEQPLYRERNFSLQIELIDLNGRKVNNPNKIPMSLALYTCENPPKFIEKNTAGQKMLKGYIDQALINGECLFEKIQIREVTSHYRNGWLFLVAIPCMTPLGANKCANFIDFTLVKPLVMGEVTVKAKKPKKKREDEQGDKWSDGEE